MSDSPVERFSHGIIHPVGSFYGVIQDDDGYTRPKKPQTFWNSKQKHPQGNTHPGAQPNLYPNRRAATRIAVSARLTETPAQPEAIDGSVVGRRHKVRRAIVAQ